MNEQEEKHPLAEYFNNEPHRHNHYEYAEIFQKCLPEEIHDKLFNAEIGSRLQALTVDDFKPCEDRRLLHYSARYDRYLDERIVYKVDFLRERWECASSFATSICEEFEICKSIQPMKEEIAALEKSVKMLSNALCDKPQIDYDKHDIEKSIALKTQKERLACLKIVRRDKGTVRTKAEGHRENYFAYRIHHLTFCHFGDAPPGSRGKYSGRGLPFLTAKIVNRLFEVEKDNKFTTKTVSQIYERGAERIAPFKEKYKLQIWGRESWTDV